LALVYTIQHIAAQNQSKRTSKFFNNNPLQKKPFFSPALQLKPADEKAEATPGVPEETTKYLEELNRDFDEARKNLCELSRALFKQAINTGSTINRDTPMALDTFSSVAANCSSLSGYIKLKPKSITEPGIYKTYEHNYTDDYTGSKEGRDRFDANAWHRAVKQGTNAGTREEIAGVGGFYQRSNDTINLPKDATLGSALHESMHRMSGNRFRSFTRKTDNPDFLSEGATQFFTDKVLMDIGLPKMSGHKYGSNVAAIENLVRKMNGNFDPLARLYFQDDMAAFHEILFQLQLAPDMKTMIANPGQKIYDAVKTQ
jgi:hypothetical protein